MATQAVIRDKASKYADRMRRIDIEDRTLTKEGRDMNAFLDGVVMYQNDFVRGHFTEIHANQSIEDTAKLFEVQSAKNLCSEIFASNSQSSVENNH